MKNNVSSVSKKNCCGCSACFSICPKKAIEMKKDSQGFFYPLVSNDLCVSCGLCTKVCSSKQINKKSLFDCFAIRHKEDSVLFKSSSGGVSNALASYCLNKNGIVYGAVYGDNFEVIIQRIERNDELEKLYGSKYVQANPKNTLYEVGKDLLGGKMVLFFGTSCQISGLISYLDIKRINRDRLVTVDLICHGVPSPGIFSDYINWINKNRRLKKFDFRTKYKPWGYGSKNFGCSIYYTSLFKKRDKIKTDTLKSRVFLNIFFSNNCLRPFCYDCPFIGMNKPSDITIADYWGCKEQEPEFFSEKGVSAVIAQTKKGNIILNDLDNVYKKETTIEKICIKQGMMHNSCSVPSSYDSFWSDYNKHGFSFIARKYGNYNLKNWVKKTIKKALNRN